MENRVIKQQNMRYYTFVIIKAKALSIKIRVKIIKKQATTISDQN